MAALGIVARVLRGARSGCWACRDRSVTISLGELTLLSSQFSVILGISTFGDVCNFPFTSGLVSVNFSILNMFVGMADLSTDFYGMLRFHRTSVDKSFPLDLPMSARTRSLRNLNPVTLPPNLSGVSPGSW